MTTAAARLPGDDGLAADAMQAAYFRGTLVDERQQVAAHVAEHRDEMARCLTSGSASAVTHLRAQVASMEAELLYLDELIAGLDRRFATSWSVRD
ncbi:hypothetical protein MMAD_35620 [Mycolicibacterium madagascariense]|uniref:Uncharacterized protein n=1 Tax=Mycolicibacterium madagascariense TaxID=212765 RepID=A0A7I7XJ79_9MYCO|nr:hypothetical protein [Mycolicibacterium madagascariense]MCV7013827.1 hypothetical protein [Mycolicibacterium madagascariense]BBZ29267.1 hypothetical protein MMAD_35620 [Mycolicibacterium madagascariense]